MFAGAQPHTQGPFAQDRPSSSSPPLPTPTQPAYYQPQLPSSCPASTSATLPLPAQHDSLPPALSAAADSAFPPSSSFRFGSFSPGDVGKPPSAGSLGFSVVSQASGKQQPGVQCGSVLPLGQLDPGLVLRQATGQIELPSGPLQGPSPVAQSPIGPAPVPVGSNAPGPAHAVQHPTSKPNEPAVNSGHSKFSAVPTAAQPSIGADTIPDAVSAAMHASAELRASQASISLPMSPLPARADSTASNTSPGHFNPDGMRLSNAS